MMGAVSHVELMLCLCWSGCLLSARVDVVSGLFYGALDKQQWHLHVQVYGDFFLYPGN